MRNILHVLVFVAGAGLFFLAAMALWMWETIPPEIDPNTLVSRILEPPSAAYLDAVEEGRSVARSLVAEEKLPGLSLAVAVAGETVWAEGFGLADQESQTPVTPATLFRIGGVSQPLTAAAVGLLSERGRLDLDAPVQNYVPSFPRKQWPLSTRQLMAHTAGIHNRNLGEDGILLKASCANDAERLALFADDPLRFRPGTEYFYSTYGWVLVGAVVAAAANEPYLDFMKREILTPLSMESTVPDIAGQTPGSAHFYFPRLMLDPRYGLQDAPAVDLSCILPAGGFLSTPSDLVRFGAAMMSDVLLDPATVEELQTAVRLASEESTGQALGWAVSQAPMGADGTPTRIVSQGLGDTVQRGRISASTVGGQVTGGTTSLIIVPAHRVALAVTTNVSGARNVSLLTARLADVFIRFLGTRPAAR